MINYEKYEGTFKETFEITSEQVKNLKYQDIPQWDSIGHMNLVAAIEDSFDIMMDTDDIVDFNSFEKGMEILKEHYQIEL